MTRAICSVLAVLALAACSKERPKQRYEFIVRVESDPGRKLAGAAISHAGTKVGASNDDGVVKLSARGKEGETLSFRVDCPEGHKSPSEPLAVVLRRVADRERRPEYNVSCLPTTRTVVVAVRADEGPNLPVRHLGREVARTDKSGAAHVLLKAAPNEAIELSLDTTAYPQLSPKNPAARFQTGHQDDVFVFSQAFTIPQPKQRPRPRRPSKPSGPTRL